MPEPTYELLREIALATAKAASATLWPVLLAIAKFESVWDPAALGDYKLVRGGPIVERTTPGSFPCSFGYLQFYTDGGLGDGHPVDKLLDGAYNMRLGATSIQDQLDLGRTLYQALRPWSTRDAAINYLPSLVVALEGSAPDGAGILPLIDDIWGALNTIETQAERIRQQLIALKRAAGLE